MSRPAPRIVLSVSAAVVVLFGLFVVSVATWGSWWRFSGMPTAEEWSALFGASALIALAFAWYQIRQVDQSNMALIASNELARQVNIEAVRPRVQVALEAHRLIGKSRAIPAEGMLYIAVRNIGASPAHDVRLSVSPPFTSLEQFFKPGMMSEHFAEVNRAFNGDVFFRTLNPGSTYIWVLGQVPRIFAEGTGIPRCWEVSAEYRGTMSHAPFRDVIILDLDVEKRIELAVDPLVRIGKDIEVVGDKLKALTGRIPTLLGLSSDAVAAIGGGSVTRVVVARNRRKPSWLRRRRKPTGA